MQEPKIILKKVKVHNLKGVDLELDHNQLIVFTGVSGSGKSSLAFDTIYVEGQRRYVESLSTYARRHLGDLPKPDAELISGISPTIAIEQKTAGRNPRSTVGTMTGIYDFLRVLYARIGVAHCPVSGEVVTPQSAEHILRTIREMPKGTRLVVLAPFARNKKAEFREDFAELVRKGFMRVRLDGKIVDLSEEIKVDGKVAHDVDIVIDRLSVEEDNRLAEAVNAALETGQGLMSVVDDKGVEALFSQHAYSAKSGLSYGPLEPSDFSFNHPSGMCPSCQGLGIVQEFDLERIIDPEISIAEDCCEIASSYTTVRYGNIYDNLARLYGFDVRTPWKKLPEKAKKVFLYGTEKKWTEMRFVHPHKRSRWTEYVQWKGVIYEAMERFNQAKSDVYRQNMRELMHESVCSACEGQRIKPYPAAATVGRKRIAEVTALAIDDALAFFQGLKLTKQEKLIGEELLKEIVERLRFLNGVGLHYLAIDRSAPTLSGGESQRVRLASQIGSGLVGATYVLDEPSIGLHPRDNTKLLETLKALRDKGNTVIVVEHDEETVRAADTVVDVGPLAGQFGGKIIVKGSINDLIASKESITGAYLSGREQIPIPKRRKAEGALTIEGACHHNLKKIDVEVPLKIFVAVTGVSGSGKSSLISDTLYPALSNHLHNAQLSVGKHKAIKGLDLVDKVIAIDQTPIGRTPRSNPATFIKLFDDIRDLFCQLPESVAQGYKAGRFSFNVKEGSCPHCSGMGMIKIDMDFMEDEWVPCEHCKGQRFDPNTLAVLYRGKNIYEVLEMTVAEGLDFFAAIPHIKVKLDTLMQVGLDYIKLGQPSPTVSGGEAQRIKLAKELSRPSSGNTLYILDEPTTGLHFHDIKKLVGVLQRLVDRGNTVLVIEHNMDLVKTADWIIDLGPEGGKFGGELVASGTPEKIGKLETPTGLALRAFLKPHPQGMGEKTHPKQVKPLQAITIEGAEQNNLKKIDVSIPRGKITLCTGVSGSGKSSFAFETVYAEGQRRYIESMSPYARQFVKQMPKPKVEQVAGLSPAIAIEQKTHAGNPRSTIGTMTEAYDFLRLLYAHLGTAYCPDTGEEIRTISKDYVLKKLLALPARTKVQVLSPLALKRSEKFEDLKERLQRQGFLRIRLNNVYYELDQEVPFDKQRKNELYLVIDRLMVSDENAKRLFAAIDQAATLSGGTLVAALEDKDLYFNLAFAVESTGKSYPPITPHTFSFNTEQGMCPDCQGLGFQYGADLSRHADILKMCAADLVLMLWKDHYSKEAYTLFLQVMKSAGIDTDEPIGELSPKALQVLFNGAKEAIKRSGTDFTWRGLNTVIATLAKSSDPLIREILLPFLEQNQCRSCEGARLNPLARNVRIDKLSIADLCRLPIDDAHAFIEKIQLSSQDRAFLDETLRQLKHRLHFLRAIGLGYLSLERSAPTLSGGESQRIRLARQLGSGLTGCLYVLDEPTIGLHPHDNERLNDALKKLCSLGNTLLLVEHDPLTVQLADHIVDFGPEAGKQGGHVIASGTLKEIMANPHSLTGQYLSGAKKIPLPKKRRKAERFIHVSRASLHNVKNLDTSIPVKAITCITGVSGSGKSTFLTDLLQPAAENALRGKRKGAEEVAYQGAQFTGFDAFDKLLVLDQNPIGHTIRADVSTYVDLLSPLRHFFASLPEAQARGLGPKNFSFNHKKGMCTTCWGLGTRSISMQFLPPVKVTCEACHGYRLNPLSLKVSTKGKHLGQILQMTVVEALAFLPPIPKAVRILETLISVGLGYLQLGQEIATLSGGEAQRMRLSRELSKRSTGSTLYLLDEPTVGLHADDIVKLLQIFERLVEKGNTVVLIEHNLDVIASADHLIDMGPGSGMQGGKIVAAGTPEEVARHKASRTAPYLRDHLKFLT